MEKTNATRSSTPTLRELAASPLSFDAIAAQHGEEVAIQVGILRDPDTHELTAAEADRLQPAPRRGRGKQKAPVKVRVSVRLDADLVEKFRDSGRGWQTRMNGMLRRSVFGEQVGFVPPAARRMPFSPLTKTPRTARKARPSVQQKKQAPA